MKAKIVRLTAIFLILIFCLVGCKSNEVVVYELTEENAWEIFPVENAPVKTVRAGDTWYSLLGSYGSGEFRLSVSDTYYSFDTVYETAGVSIWFFEANEKCAAWCEMTADARVFMIYDTAKAKTEEIFRIGLDDGYQNANVGVYEDGVYFTHIDYDKESACIMRYSVNSGMMEEFYRLEYKGEYSCTGFSVDGGTLLLCSGRDGMSALTEINLKSGTDTVRKLDKSVGFVYGCAYDTVTKDSAIYYRDTEGKDHIGVVYRENGKIKNLFTFGENVYAYYDTLESYGGHVYWVNQANVTGIVSDHYRFIDYNYVDGTVEEYIRTFSFTVVNDGIILLSFNKAEYDAIYLSEIYLGGEKE